MLKLKFESQIEYYNNYMKILDILILFLWMLRNMEENRTHNEFLIETERLPDNLDFMPTLSNGHIGLTVWGDSVFMNGVYNGHSGNSRRARIPNWINVSATIITEELHAEPQISHVLDLKGGHFTWFQNYTELGIMLEHRTYPHRYFNRAIVYELCVKRTLADKTLLIKLSRNPGVESDAFYFTPINNISNEYKLLKGVTRVVENERFQQQPHTIFIAFNEEFKADKLLHLIEGEKELRFFYIMTIDQNATVALRELDAIQSLKNKDDILTKHVAEWNAFWNDFSIEIKGNLELSHIVNAGIFYLVSSLPSPNTFTGTETFYGLSPTGLGRGVTDDDYEGHNFWDTEMWMLPVISQCSVAWAEILLQYRYKCLNAAKYHAEETGFQGARYPWESAYTGTEVTNPDYPEVAELQVHISADIVFALRQHYALTNDKDWLKNTAWPIVREICIYLESRVTFDESNTTYHVKDVMGPDEDHLHVNDNVYTNIIFKMALEFACLIQPICDPLDKAAAERWHQISKGMYIHYDTALDYHPEHVGYEKNDIVKQADVILIGYPLHYVMNLSTRINDLQHYENCTRASGPAMTWSMFSINNLDVDDMNKGDEYFHKSYADYVDPVFKVWSEVKRPSKGAANFLTGIGGFLQAIMNGYAGLRIKLDDYQPVLEIQQPRVLPNCEEFSIKGIKFADGEFTIKLKNNTESTIICDRLGKYKLIHKIENKITNIEEGTIIILNHKETLRIEISQNVV